MASDKKDARSKSSKSEKVAKSKKSKSSRSGSGKSSSKDGGEKSAKSASKACGSTSEVKPCEEQVSIPTQVGEPQTDTASLAPTNTPPPEQTSAVSVEPVTWEAQVPAAEEDVEASVNASAEPVVAAEPDMPHPAASAAASADENPLVQTEQTPVAGERKTDANNLAPPPARQPDSMPSPTRGMGPRGRLLAGSSSPRAAFGASQPPPPSFGVPPPPPVGGVALLDGQTQKKGEHSRRHLNARLMGDGTYETERVGRIQFVSMARTCIGLHDESGAPARSNCPPCSYLHDVVGMVCRRPPGGTLPDRWVDYQDMHDELVLKQIREEWRRKEAEKADTVVNAEVAENVSIFPCKSFLARNFAETLPEGVRLLLPSRLQQRLNRRRRTLRHEKTGTEDLEGEISQDEEDVAAEGGRVCAKPRGSPQGAAEPTEKSFADKHIKETPGADSRSATEGPETPEKAPAVEDNAQPASSEDAKAGAVETPADLAYEEDLTFLGNGGKVVAVINLCMTERYYSQPTLRRDGIEAYWIKVDGSGDIPDDKVFCLFFRVIAFLAHKYSKLLPFSPESFATGWYSCGRDKMQEETVTVEDTPTGHAVCCDKFTIVVHCTHGVNRTGLFVSLLLATLFNCSAEFAVKAYEAKRGAPLSKEVFVNWIRQKCKAGIPERFRSALMPPEVSSLFTRVQKLLLEGGDLAGEEELTLPTPETLTNALDGERKEQNGRQERLEAHVERMRQLRAALKAKKAEEKGEGTHEGQEAKERDDQQAEGEEKAEGEKAEESKDEQAASAAEDSEEGQDAEETKENEELSRERALEVPKLPARLPADGIVLFGPIQSSLLAPEELLVSLLSSQESAKISGFEIMTGDDLHGQPHPYPQLLTTLRTRRRETPEKGRRGDGNKRRRGAKGKAGAAEEETQGTGQQDGGPPSKEEMKGENGENEEACEEVEKKKEASVKSEKEAAAASDEDSKGHVSEDGTEHDTPAAKKRRLEAKLEDLEEAVKDEEDATAEMAEKKVEETQGEGTAEQSAPAVPEPPNIDELSIPELHTKGQGLYSQKQIAYRLIQFREEDPLRLHYIVKVQCADIATFEWLLSHSFGRMRQQMIQGYPSSLYKLLYLRGKRRDKELFARAQEVAQAENAARQRNRNVAAPKKGFRTGARPGAPGPFMGSRPGVAPPPPFPGIRPAGAVLPPPPAPFGPPVTPGFPAPPFLPPIPGMAPRGVPCAPGVSQPPYPPGASPPLFCPPPPGAPPAPGFGEGGRRDGPTPPGPPGPFPGRLYEPRSPPPPGAEPPRMYDPDYVSKSAGEMGYRGYESQDRDFYGREPMKSPQYPRGPGGETGGRRGPCGSWGPGGPEGDREGYHNQASSPTERGPYMRRGPGPAGFGGPEGMRDGSLTRHGFGEEKRPFGPGCGGFGFEGTRGGRGPSDDGFGSGARGCNESGGRGPFPDRSRRPPGDYEGRGRDDFDRGYGPQNRGGMYSNTGGTQGFEGPGFRGRGFGFSDESPGAGGDRHEPGRVRGFSSDRFGDRVSSDRYGDRGDMWPRDGPRDQDEFRRFRDGSFRNAARDNKNFSNFGYGNQNPAEFGGPMGERGGDFRARMESGSGVGGRGEDRGSRRISGWSSGFEDSRGNSQFGRFSGGDRSGFDRFADSGERGSRFGDKEQAGGFGRRQGRPNVSRDFRRPPFGGSGSGFADGSRDDGSRVPSLPGPPQWTIQKGPEAGGPSPGAFGAGHGQMGDAPGVEADKFRTGSAPPGIGPTVESDSEDKSNLSASSVMQPQSFGIGGQESSAQNAFAQFAKQLASGLQDGGQGGNSMAATMAMMGASGGSQQAMQQQLVALLSQQQMYGNSNLQGADMQQLMMYAQYYGCLLNGMSEQQAAAVVQTQQLLQQQQQQLVNQQLLQQSIQQQQQLQLSLAGLMQTGTPKPDKKV
ncbi:hypothetical protein TGDOM2_305790 [Toxoplasma gondii GAB2-2007-GAL-DOM2]|uniref:Tyrosine specific protein phosphatases domain-containing protein n=4 Tax=Toxoplasma gondii TaxID=5811 RepID=A0A086KL18_TOXGO|nr:hypothetical protein TGRH88_017350 [Toxoplasma gondii]KFG33429.1 hypothetical protein TGDOM2_305790 [Toxoplasma gondii GAB2-2007-GAL-DOM2]KFG45086.1 hypothetical protein TGFOU_305790 [Toxoplasma gondii FOU]RQX67918.1 hypothetical protein TGCAST_305790 [Toxoplasma gondii CAST]